VELAASLGLVPVLALDCLRSGLPARLLSNDRLLALVLQVDLQPLHPALIQLSDPVR
jgi:hypothetical protein